MVSDLCYAGKSLAEIAGYSTVQMRHMLFLPRDKYGRLLDAQDELPPGVEVDESGRRVISPNNRAPFTQSFRKTKRRQGLTEQEAQAAWDKYLQRNPSLVALIERSAKARKAREKARARQKLQSKQPAGA